MRKFWLHGVLLAMLATSLMTFSSCGKSGSSGEGGKPKLLIIGLDGADWHLINPMLEAGELPNLGRLIEKGVHGDLRSLEPLAKSPAIWTTIATGKSPAEHGIRSFVDRVHGRPLTRNIRRARALWNIFSSVNRTVGVVGWLMSWPAEKVNGFVVSDYLQYDAAPSQRVMHRTYPPELEEEVMDYVVHWQDVPWSFVQRFLDEPVDTTAMTREQERLFRPIRWIAGADMTFARVAAKLYKERRPDFMAVYLRGTDSMGHLYWNFMTPEAVPEGSLNPDGLKYCKGAMRAYYRYTDELIGPLLKEVDKNTAVIVVSDHGFKGGPGHGVQQHRLDGILIMAGRGVGHGEITGANVYDITPTALVLMGLPPAQDMQGKVLWAGLDPSIPRDKFTPGIATYETGEETGRGEEPMESPVDEQLKERLKSLGYIE